MDRRQMLLSLAGGVSASLLTNLREALSAEETPKANLGVVLYALGIRQRFLRSQKKRTATEDPRGFLEYCHQLGAGGIQVPLGVRDQAQADELRRAAEERGMFVEGIAGLPYKQGDVDRFAAQLATAARAGRGLCAW